LSILCISFPMKLIHNIRNRIANKCNAQHNETHTHNTTWITFTYYSPLVHKITNLFKHTNINTAFRSTNTIYQQLYNQPTTNRLHASGIYRLQCETCAKSYVGQSGRSMTDIGNMHSILELTTQFLHMLYISWTTNMNMDRQNKPYTYYRPATRKISRTSGKHFIFKSYTNWTNSQRNNNHQNATPCSRWATSLNSSLYITTPNITYINHPSGR
jgi:hypothetical protein